MMATLRELGTLALAVSPLVGYTAGSLWVTAWLEATRVP